MTLRIFVKSDLPFSTRAAYHAETISIGYLILFALIMIG